MFDVILPSLDIPHIVMDCGLVSDVTMTSSRVTSLGPTLRR